MALGGDRGAQGDPLRGALGGLQISDCGALILQCSLRRWDLRKLICTIGGGVLSKRQLLKACDLVCSLEQQKLKWKKRIPLCKNCLISPPLKRARKYRHG